MDTVCEKPAATDIMCSNTAKSLRVLSALKEFTYRHLRSNSEFIICYYSKIHFQRLEKHEEARMAIDKILDYLITNKSWFCKYLKFFRPDRFKACAIFGTHRENLRTLEQPVNIRVTGAIPNG